MNAALNAAGVLLINFASTEANTSYLYGMVSLLFRSTVIIIMTVITIILSYFGIAVAHPLHN